MKSTIFREYDIRGKVGTELIIEHVYALTHAILFYYKQQIPLLQQIVVGMDGRTHSPLIKDRVCAAIMEAGYGVIDVGTCPSPVLYFAESVLPVQAGIMITASHNPKEYNGFKLVLQHESVCGAQIQRIKEYYQEGVSLFGQTLGSITLHDIIPDYIKSLTKEFFELKHKTMPIVFDCGNGATSVVIKRIVDAFEWKKVQLLYDHIDGEFPNHEADPVVEKNMLDVKKVLATTHAVLGIGFDGDGDRMGAMTKEGDLLTGDQLLALFAQPILQEQKGGSVVCNVLASSALLEQIKNWGGSVYMTAAGHSNIKECMKKTGALVGGESSCHFFFIDGRHPGYDDAVYAALRLLELLDKTGKTIPQLLAAFPQKISSLEYRIPCLQHTVDQIIARIKEFVAHTKDVELLTIDGVRVTLPFGWFIVRKSNTQEVVSIRFESDTKEGYEYIKKLLLGFFDNLINTESLQGQAKECI